MTLSFPAVTILKYVHLNRETIFLNTFLTLKRIVSGTRQKNRLLALYNSTLFVQFQFEQHPRQFQITTLRHGEI